MPLRDVEIDDGEIPLDAAVDDGDLAQKDQQAVAEVVEDRLLDLAVGGAQPLAQHQHHLAGELRRRIQQLAEGLVGDEDKAGVGERGGAGAPRQAVEKGDLADHLALLQEADGGLAAVLGGEVDAHDAGDDDVEPVGLLALLEQDGAGGQRQLAADAAKAAQALRVDPLKTMLLPSQTATSLADIAHSPLPAKVPPSIARAEWRGRPRPRPMRHLAPGGSLPGAGVPCGG